MSVYFINTYDALRSLRDEFGVELPHREAARQIAMRALPDMAQEILPDGDRRDFIADVRDETGRVIFTATLSLVARWLD